MDIGFLIAYLALPVLAFVLVRSVMWLAIALSLGFALGGAGIALAQQYGVFWHRSQLQLVLLAVLAGVAIAGFLSRRFSWPDGRVGLRRQLLVVGLPMLLIALAVIAVRRIADADGLWSVVTYFINQPVAEDNSKWLDFSAQLASGAEIRQAVPLGGPLQLFIVFTGTVAASISQMVFGGVNQVFVAAWSAVFGQFGLVILVPLALAPLAEARVRLGSVKRGWTRELIPAPVIWLGMLVMVAASFLVTRNGHLTLQFVFLTVGLWVLVFVGGPQSSRARILTSLAVVVSATVWLPLNVIAVGVLVCLVVLAIRRLVLAAGSQGGLRGYDWLSLGVLVFVAISMWSPLLSGLVFGANISTAPASGALMSAGGAGVRTAVAFASPILTALPPAETFLEGLQLFTANGGTATTGPILGLLAGASLVLAISIATRRRGSQPSNRLQRALPFIPALVLVGYVSLLTVADMWVTGSGPHYGALKMMFFVTIVVLSTCLPFAIMQIDRRRGGLTLARGATVVVVAYLLVVDGLLPKAAAEVRPAQWPMAGPFGINYWWPAEVKHNTADQTIAGNPIGCVYLPPGAKVPTVLPDGQRLYSCTRLLVGLSGMDTTARPLVDWMRREWLTNTGSWMNEYDWIAGMPEDVRATNLILLDEANNVVGLESIGSLVSRFPKFAGKTPAELAEIGVATTSG